MSLFRDIRSVWLLHLKGLLFLVTGFLAFTGVFLEMPTLRIGVLLAIGAWASCRFYYYLFYVLEKYAGVDQRYAGVFDALKRILKKKQGD